MSTTLVKIYLSCIITNRGKNTFELVGTVLNSYILYFLAILETKALIERELHYISFASHLQLAVQLHLLGPVCGE